MSSSRRFQLRECPSWGLLHDCETLIFAKVRFQLCSFHRAESHKVRGRTSVKRGPAQYKYSGHWVWPPGPARDNYSSGPRGREQQRSHAPPAPTHGTSNPGGLMVTFAAKNAIAFLGRLLVSSNIPCSMYKMASVAAWFLSQSALNICNIAIFFATHINIKCMLYL